MKSGVLFKYIEIIGLVVIVKFFCVLLVRLSLCIMIFEEILFLFCFILLSINFGIECVKVEKLVMLDFVNV